MWFISDSHFFHNNVIKYSNRPFSSVEEMNETLVKNWNDKVSKTDVIYHLGDVIFAKHDNQFQETLGRLNGKKILIKGNHDDYKSYSPFWTYWDNVYDYKEVKYDGTKFMLMHFPLAVWNKGHRGALHLFGHSHSSLNYKVKGTTQMDVGVDSGGHGDKEDWKYRPIHAEEIIEYLKDCKYPYLDNHGQKYND